MNGVEIESWVVVVVVSFEIIDGLLAGLLLLVGSTWPLSWILAGSTGPPLWWVLELLLLVGF